MRVTDTITRISLLIYPRIITIIPRAFTPTALKRLQLHTRDIWYYTHVAFRQQSANSNVIRRPTGCSNSHLCIYDGIDFERNSTFKIRPNA